ncbi:MAG: rRNA pseudouridine synthase [Thermoguttaceae bacterium]|nr:rRNA pseudouridine synthase [Thermoguttaceae bacterium]MDW8036627.1 pseudouridine synthase [Thermoguttaceae bacterium]
MCSSAADSAHPKSPALAKAAQGSESPRQTSQAIRLQKVLAAAGLGSRRKCEELILAGRVEVDGQLVTELGTRVDPYRQEIRVDGQRIRLQPLVYYAVNKPSGVVCTHRDPSGRTRLIDLVPASKGVRLFPVGRLDLHSEGLILVTNDGQLANRLTHPRYGVEKTYRVQVAGLPTPEILQKLQRGVWTSEGKLKAERIKVLGTHKKSTFLEMVLAEGRNRQIRRMLARVGHKVMKLKRLAVGPIRLGKLKPGACRPLTQEEIQALYKAAGLKHLPPSQKQPEKKKRK